MKISVIVRVHNEYENLPKFLDAYRWADRIFVQDDNSDDKSYLFNITQPNVVVTFYDGERIVREDLTRAKQHIQLNQLIHLAEDYGTDWIIMDDCDCFPNLLLRNYGKIKFLTEFTKDFVYLTRIYLYQDKGYFPKLSQHKSQWTQGLWAWRANQGFRFKDNGDGPQTFDEPDESNIHRLLPPYALLHHPWPNDEVIAQKRERYIKIYGNQFQNFDPLKTGGQLKPLEEWMK